MRTLTAIFLASAATAMAQAQTSPPAPATPPPALAPSEIVAAAPAADWVAIPASDLLIMTLAPDPRGGAGHTGERRVVIQLMPAPFSQGWVGNIRTLAAAHWWDGTSINRVQDNYVVQWGDATEAKPLPEGLRVVPANDYAARPPFALASRYATDDNADAISRQYNQPVFPDASVYARNENFFSGWPIANDRQVSWPVHCYAMVGVGRNLSPDTGSGAELYTVIGHAPRHLDRNIALIGRVIEGIEHLSSLPRGTGALGFYATAEERVGIVSVRLASDLPAAEQPRFHYLSTETATFARYADARANRRDPFFNVPAGGADICNIPVPVRRVPQG